MWQFTGTQRPSFASPTGPGQESVWDFPRPPISQPDSRDVRVAVGELEIARTRAAIRVLETASPPTFYLPPADVNWDLLVAAPGSSFCEWKGQASYWSVVAANTRIVQAAWSYPAPSTRFTGIAGYVSFYPAKVECWVDGERVRPQPGGFYGGWMTDEIVGPVKGEPGTGGW